MKTFTIDANQENWDLLKGRYDHEFNQIDTRQFLVCRIVKIDTAREGEQLFIDRGHASTVQGAYLSHDEVCGFTMLDTLEQKMAYLKAISKEQKEKKACIQL